MVQKRTMGRRLVKWVAISLGSMLLLVILVIILLQTPSGQSLIKNQAEKYLRNKLQTRLSVGSLHFENLSGIHLSNLYLEDQQKRQLLSIDRLDISYDFSALFRKYIILTEINIRGVNINLERDSSSQQFNYDFIPQAFASPADTSKVKDSSGFSIHLGKVFLDSIHFSMKDDFGGQFYSVDLPKFRTDITSSDIDKLHFHANYVLSDGLNCSFILKETGKTGELVIDTENVTSAFRVMADSVAINNTHFSFENKTDQSDIKTSVGTLTGLMVDYQSDKLNATADLLAIKDHSTDISMKSAQTTLEEKNKVKVVTPATFTFYVDSIAVDNNHISYNDNAQPKIGGHAIDYSHIGLDQLTTHISGIGFNGKFYTGKVHDLAVHESSGFVVKQLSGEVSYSDSSILLKKILLKTGRNQLNLDANIKIIPGIKPAETNYRITAGMSSAALHLDELLYFQPGLKKNKYFSPLINKSIELSTQIEGTLDNLHIPRLTIREAGNRISASAEVLHLPDTKRMVINFYLNQFSSTRQGILSYLPRGTIPDSLLHYIPETFSLRGTYKGGLDNMYTDLSLNSADGNATIKGRLKNITDTKKAAYDVTLTTENIDLAKLLNDTSMGKVTAKVVAKGSGFEMTTAVANFNVHVDDAYYKGYSYHKVDVNGKVNRNTIDANLNSKDPNLDLAGNVFLNLNPGSRGFRTNTDIRNIDLQALGFTKDSIQLKTMISADFPLIDSNGMQGNMLMRESYVNLQGKPIFIDTMTLDAVHVTDSQSVVFKSPLADFSVVGQFRLPALGPAFRTIADNYLLTTGTDTVFTTDVKAEYRASFRIPDSIISRVPGVKSIAPFHVVGNIDTKKNELNLFSTVSSLKMSSIDVDTLNIAFVTQDAAQKYDDMRYSISLAVLTGSSYELKASTLQGSIKRGIIDGLLRLDDENAHPRYLIPFVYSNDPERPNIIIRDSLMINKEYWSVSKDNVIYLNPKKLSGSNITLRDKNTSVELTAAEDNKAGLPLQVTVREFNIRDIAELVISDTALAGGMMNGQMSISSFEPLIFTTHLSLDSLTLMKSKLGNIKADVEQKEAGLLAVNTTLKSEKNDIALNGSYKTETSEPDLQLDINKFDLATLQPILYDYLGDLHGNLHSNLKITGSMDKPVLNGAVTTDSLHAIYAMAGTYIRIPKAELGFDEQGIKFQDLVITDSSGHEGRINGAIQTADYRHLNLDLSIKMTNFEVVGRKKFPRQDIYGPANADINLTLKGTEKSATLEGSVQVKDKSLFTYVYQPSINEELGNGLIEFFDPLKPGDTAIVKKKIGKSVLGFQFLTNLYVHVTPSSTVEIMLDETSGDHLVLNGNADLNFIMRPGGETILTGGYQLDAGQYELSLAGVIRKTFKIEKGSSIIWNGDPLKGTMNITALYQTKTAAGPLVNDIEQIPGIDRQKLNFNVYIILKNELLKPDIEFRLDMEEQDQEAFGGLIYNRIKQVNSIPAELNKQVMGLLAFNQFIAENPFNTFTSGDDDFGTQAFNTAGNMLTQQLADMIGRYVKDIDIDIGLEQEKDYTSGTAVKKTDLNVGVTKSLADSRLNVYVGSSFALEGANQNETALEGLAGDATLEYLLTSDGRFRVKGYRLTENEFTFQGNVVRTGVSFVVVLEFNKFKNAFKKPRNKRR